VLIPVELIFVRFECVLVSVVTTPVIAFKLDVLRLVNVELVTFKFKTVAMPVTFNLSFVNAVANPTLEEILSMYARLL